MNKGLAGLIRKALALTLGLAFVCSAVAAPSDAERIADLERKLELLTQRLNQVETGNPARTGAPAPQAPAPATPVAAPAPPAALLPRPAETGIPIRAFIDVGFARDSPDPAGRKGGFTVGNVNLYMTPSLGERVKSIVELVFEQGEDGRLVVDLERVQLGYAFSDALTAWAGRFHTPFGYWNAAFHHGAQIQTSVLRPRFLAFEDQGGILPVHSVGLLGSGSVPLAGGRTKYDLFVANGTPIEDGVLTVSGFKDDDRQKLFGANLRHEFGGGLQGLTLGVHALSSQVGSYDAGGALRGRTRLNLGGAFVVFERQPWELIGEYYGFRNRDLSSGTGTHTSWAAFGQLGYTLGDVLTFYGRVEKAALNQNDRYFSTMGSGRSYRRESVGTRYDLNPSTALKLEFGRTTEERASVDLRWNGIRGQFAVRF